MVDPAVQKKLDELRFERLKEVLAEYLDDENGSATRLINDLERAALENSQYFVGRVDEYTTLRDFFS